MKSIKILAGVLCGLISAILFSSLQIRSTAADSGSLIGAWSYGPVENRTVMINTDNVFSVATYNIPGKKFISSYGGTWRLEGDKRVEKIEWNSKDPEEVGKEITKDFDLKNGKLYIEGVGESWTRVDDGTPGELMGAWIITGTYSHDKVTKRQSPFFPRRTMKVLSGTQFHWVAYNVNTREFVNAGGGTYTTANGKYTEQIEFFTKTAESVGKVLPFDYSFVNGDWRHRGQKSTGGVMDECWTRRERLEK